MVPSMANGAHNMSQGKFKPAAVGMAVRSRPTTLAYRCGDTSGKVEAIDGTRIMVRMDQSGRLVPFQEDQLVTELEPAR